MTLTIICEDDPFIFSVGVSGRFILEEKYLGSKYLAIHVKFYLIMPLNIISLITIKVVLQGRDQTWHGGVIASFLPAEGSTFMEPDWKRRFW